MSLPRFKFTRFFSLASIVLLIGNLQAADKMADLGSGSPELQKKSLYSKATLLGNLGYWTIVPKRSIINSPDSLKSKVISAPKGKYLPFHKFLSRNHSWLHSYPISLEYARGKKSMEKFRFEALKRVNKVVITTYKNNPVSFHKRAYPQETERNAALSKK